MVELNYIAIASLQDLQNFRLVFEDRYIALEVRHGLRDIGERIQETFQYLQPRRGNLKRCFCVNYYVLKHSEQGNGIAYDKEKFDGALRRDKC